MWRTPKETSRYVFTMHGSKRKRQSGGSRSHGIRDARLSKSSVVADFEKLSSKPSPVHHQSMKRRGTFFEALKGGVSSINTFIKEQRVLDQQDAAAAAALVVESARKHGQSPEFRASAAATNAKATLGNAHLPEEGTGRDGEKGEHEQNGEDNGDSSDTLDGENERESEEDDDAVADGLRKTVRDRSEYVGLELVINCEGSRFLLKVGAGNQTVKWLALAVAQRFYDANLAASKACGGRRQRRHGKRILQYKFMPQSVHHSELGFLKAGRRLKSLPRGVITVLISPRSGEQKRSLWSDHAFTRDVGMRRLEMHEQKEFNAESQAAADNALNLYRKLERSIVDAEARIAGRHFGVDELRIIESEELVLQDHITGTGLLSYLRTLAGGVRGSDLEILVLTQFCLNLNDLIRVTLPRKSLTPEDSDEEQDQESAASKLELIGLLCKAGVLPFHIDDAVTSIGLLVGDLAGRSGFLSFGRVLEALVRCAVFFYAKVGENGAVEQSSVSALIDGYERLIDAISVEASRKWAEGGFASRIHNNDMLHIWYDNREILRRLFIAYSELSATHLLLASSSTSHSSSSSSSSAAADAATAHTVIDHAFNHAMSLDGFCALARRTGIFLKSDFDAVVNNEDEQDSISSVAFSATLKDEDTSDSLHAFADGTPRHGRGRLKKKKKKRRGSFDYLLWADFLEALARLAYLICDRSEYNGVDEDLSRDEIAQEHLAQWLWRQGGGGASGHDHHK